MDPRLIVGGAFGGILLYCTVSAIGWVLAWRFRKCCFTADELADAEFGNIPCGCYGHTTSIYLTE